MKQYTRGVFVVNGTASNDFYRASQITTIVACPSSAVSVTYDPAINVNGNAIKFNGIYYCISIFKLITLYCRVLLAETLIYKRSDHLFYGAGIQDR